jgi:hypothetical protein
VYAGYALVDFEGSGDRGIEFSVMTGTGSAVTGDNLKASDGQTVRFTLSMLNHQGAHPEIMHDEPKTPTLGKQMTSFDYRSHGNCHWFRVNVHATDVRMLILGNPIYVNFLQVLKDQLTSSHL